MTEASDKTDKVTASVNNVGGINIAFQSGSRVKAFASLSIEDAQRLIVQIRNLVRQVAEASGRDQ